MKSLALDAAPCQGPVRNFQRAASQDIFDFLSAFLTAQPAADFNPDGTIDSRDLFQFVAVWLAGC